MIKAIKSLFTGGIVMAKSLVAYFSASGVTAGLAKKLAEAAEADLFEITPENSYSEADLNWHDRESLTTIECNDPKSRPAIANKIDISDYDAVVLCYPIWWAYAPKIMYTFVESQDWNGKKLITLCTSGGSGLGRSGNDLVKFAKNADFKGGKDFTRGSSADIKKYIESLLK